MEVAGDDLERRIMCFGPLVAAVARRYTGRGAEFDDLVQEGYLALFELIPKCKDPGKLPLFLKRRLPAKVRTVARREWRRQSVPLEELEGTGEEPWVFEEPWIPDRAIVEALGPDRELAFMLAEGYTQKEAGGRLGITQQGVSARLRELRKRLAPLIEQRREGPPSHVRDDVI